MRFHCSFQKLNRNDKTKRRNEKGFLFMQHNEYHMTYYIHIYIIYIHICTLSPIFHLSNCGRKRFALLVSASLCVLQSRTRLMALCGCVYIYAILVYLVSLSQFATRLRRNSQRHLLSTHFHTNLTDALRFALLRLCRLTEYTFVWLSGQLCSKQLHSLSLSLFLSS